MSTRWTLATQPSHVAADSSSVLAEAYALLIAIARRPPASAPDASQDEAADEHRPVNKTGEAAA